MKQHRVDGFTFDYGVFTNISEGDHIGPNEHKDFAEYLYCKAMLIQHSKLGFVNKDDVHTPALMKHISGASGIFRICTRCRLYCI